MYVALVQRSAVVGLGQELFLIHHDLRERVRVQRSVLVLVRKTGSDGLVKQPDHMVEAGRTSGRRAAPADHKRHITPLEI
jgi:hypothetical protein